VLAMSLHEKLDKMKAITTQVYEVKVSRGTWKKVRATGMGALNNWVRERGFLEWRMVGMMSRSEIVESQKLEVVC